MNHKSKIMFEKDDFDHLRSDAGFSFSFWVNFNTVKKDQSQSIFYQWTEKAAFDIRVALVNKLLTVVVKNSKGEEAKMIGESQI